MVMDRMTLAEWSALVSVDVEDVRISVFSQVQHAVFHSWKNYNYSQFYNLFFLLFWIFEDIVKLEQCSELLMFHIFHIVMGHRTCIFSFCLYTWPFVFVFSPFQMTFDGLLLFSDSFCVRPILQQPPILPNLPKARTFFTSP